MYSFYRKGGKGSVFIEMEGRVQYLQKEREGYSICKREGRVQYL